MSKHGFHVHGPHEHELEAVHHEASHSGNPMNNQIAMFTAVIATIGALFGYMDNTTLVNASVYKNNAAITKTDAASQWNFYQAKSNKQNLSEFAMTLLGKKESAPYAEQYQRYENEKTAIKAEAVKLNPTTLCICTTGGPKQQHCFKYRLRSLPSRFYRKTDGSKKPCMWLAARGLYLAYWPHSTFEISTDAFVI